MIDEDRMKHILAVARLMKEKATEAGLDPEEMFLLGMMHDIGYEFGGSEEHHLVGAGILEKQGYKYYLEVLFHGKPTEEYQSPALDLLNYADMHINKKGGYVTFEDRLDMDMQYHYRKSFKNDIKILLITALITLKRKGAV